LRGAHREAEEKADNSFLSLGSRAVSQNTVNCGTRWDFEYNLTPVCLSQCV
ncbi:hypothetical protein CHARACLAT_015104, partial [Characodon lateralis]|nr:hypothetical protein [Characodon lateralis]